VLVSQAGRAVGVSCIAGVVAALASLLCFLFSCSSPLVHVTLPPGSFRLPAGPDALMFGLVFQDNQRNLQINLPLNLTLYWSA
jgi:hypothetical protein